MRGPTGPIEGGCKPLPPDGPPLRGLRTGAAKVLKPPRYKLNFGVHHKTKRLHQALRAPNQSPRPSVEQWKCRYPYCGLR